MVVCSEPSARRRIEGGAVDTVIAAYAITNDAVVVHYDGDYEHVARVRDDVRQVWIAPRGALDA